MAPRYYKVESSIVVEGESCEPKNFVVEHISRARENAVGDTRTENRRGKKTIVGIQF
jgi:hypothetical protein